MLVVVLVESEQVKVTLLLVVEVRVVVVHQRWVNHLAVVLVRNQLPQYHWQPITPSQLELEAQPTQLRVLMYEVRKDHPLFLPPLPRQVVAVEDLMINMRQAEVLAATVDQAVVEHL